MMLQHAQSFAQTADELADFERVGLDVVAVPEAYGFDAVSQLGYLAARTRTVTLLAAILPLYTRSPTLLAMTAAGLDLVSNGRFGLGLGASGPGVITGFHGIPFDAPLGRTREIIDICRAVWTRHPLEHSGRYYRVPGTGPGFSGRPLKLSDHPVRDRVPISVAAIGQKNVALVAEIGDGWQPIFFDPARASEIWGAALAEGASRRDPSLGPLEVMVQTTLGIGSLEAEAVCAMRAQLAFYIGGMGPRGQNFYNDLAVAYGYQDEATAIQDRYLSGDRAGAASIVPEALIRDLSVIGSADDVRERLAAFAAAGVGTLIVRPAGTDHRTRLAQIERLRALVDE